MAYWNDEKFIKEAMDSILNQTYKDFIFFVVGDFPQTDKSIEIVDNYADKRIVRLIAAKKLFGHGCRNFGLELIFRDYPNIQYITFQDADDFSSLDRVEKQVKFLDKNPQYGMVGCRYTQIKEDGSLIQKVDLPLDNYTIKSMHWTYNRICGAAIMVRKEILEKTGFYDLEFMECWDMELENRIMQITNVCNLPDYLYHYRLTPRTTEEKLIKYRMSFVPIIRYKMICKWLGIEFDKNKYKHAFWEL